MTIESDPAKRWYILLEVSDARHLAAAAKAEPSLGVIVARLEADTGADMEEIATRLKRAPNCHACVVEGQEHNCESIIARKLGRRLWRLIERATGQRAPGSHND